jgi:hypothetical protein
MPASPLIDPPIVDARELRLLCDQDGLSAILSGFRLARPDIFIHGSFDTTPASPPLSLAIPFDGQMVINYRIELDELAIDLPPSDKTFHGFPNPFTLASQEAALFSHILIDIAGNPATAWREEVVIDAWLRVKMLPLQTDGTLVFELTDAMVQIPGVMLPALVHIANHVLHSYLQAAVPQVRVPVGNMLKSDIAVIQLQDIGLGLNAVDVHADLQPPRS